MRMTLTTPGMSTNLAAPLIRRNPATVAAQTMPTPVNHPTSHCAQESNPDHADSIRHGPPPHLVALGPMAIIWYDMGAAGRRPWMSRERRTFQLYVRTPMACLVDRGGVVRRSGMVGTLAGWKTFAADAAAAMKYADPQPHARAQPSDRPERDIESGREVTEVHVDRDQETV